MRKLFTLLLLTAGCSVAFADVISEDQALANAGNFIEQSSAQTPMRRLAGKKPMLTKALQERGFYAFNINDNEGYIITSGSDRTQPVLGYSDHGSIDPQNMPEPLKYWLESINTAVENIEAGIPQAKAIKENNIARVADKKAIAPLVKCQWNQGEPYNLLTPSYTDQNNGSYHEHSATGCVATATSQIMYYWKWPQEACAEIPSYEYNWSGNKKWTNKLPSITFNWDAMKDTYGNNDSEESKQAVAQLMLYAGHGMKSGYAGATGATSGNALNALKNYFDYNKQAYNTYHLNYTFQEWEDLFYNELAAGRPILMGADNYERTGGHEFVCDGYDGNGLYHINWGWGGWDDGYFVLTVMAPDNQGIGGSTDANGYSMGQNICVNLCPSNVPKTEEEVRAAISALYCGQSKIAAADNGTFTLSFTYTLRTILKESYSIQHAFRIVAEDGTVVRDELVKSARIMSPSERYANNSGTCKLLLQDGTYKLMGISRMVGLEDWYYDDNSDKNYIELVVSGNEMTVTVKPGQGSKLVVNSLRLEGASVSGQWQKVVYNITNNGDDFYGETYLFVDGKRSSGNTISIPSGTTADIYYKFKPTSDPNTHSFILSRTTDTNSSNVISHIDRMFNFDCVQMADGTTSILAKAVPGVSYEVPEEAIALFLYGASPRSIAVNSANPNLVVYYDEGVSIASRVETIMRKYITNIVIGNVAKEAGFKDGYPVAVPIPFTAETVSYTRDNIEEWSTLSLPFKVEEIAVDGTPVQWFTSKDDKGKNFFVKSFSGNRGAEVRFAHTATIEANKPYLIGSSGSLNGSAFNHNGKSVTFSAKNAVVSITGENTGKYTSSDVKLLPCYAPASTSKLLGMDSKCDNFVKVSSVAPFRAYIDSSTGTTSYSIKYESGERDLGGVEDIMVEQSGIAPDAPVFNILGVKVGTYAEFESLQPGLYIVAGRKVIK